MQSRESELGYVSKDYEESTQKIQESAAEAIAKYQSKLERVEATLKEEQEASLNYQ